MADPIVEGRLRRVIRALRREGPLHILEVLRHDRRRKRWAAREEALPDTESFLSSFVRSDRNSDIPGSLAERAVSLTAPWLLDRGERDATLRQFKEEYGPEIFDAADLVASGRFTLLGLSIFEPTGRFDWHRDYSSGKIWPYERFDRIRFLEGDGADVKYPWELSRMTWIGALGLAHRLAPSEILPRSGERPSDAFRRLITDWRNENSFNRGVNWAMPMEVAIRSFWLISGLALFRDLVSEDREWWDEYISLLVGHGRSLFNTLEYLPNLTNHYIADCFGLLVVGALLIDNDEGRRWFDDGKKRLERELRRQVTEDGLHYERSLPYHGLVLELYLLASAVAKRTGEGFSKQAAEVIEKMVVVTANVLPSPGTRIPLLGDADDGRLLRILPGSDPYDHTFLMEIHDCLIDETTSPATIEGLLLCGARAGTHRNRIVRARESRLFEKGGVAVLRNNRWVVIIDVGPIGLHGNNDTLSFSLYSPDGTPWIIDPGTPCYTGNPGLRNALRSTAAHNGVMVDGKEIAEFEGLWRVREDRTATEVLEFDAGRNLLRARHHAYERHDRGGILHEREFRLEGDDLHVTDRLHGDGEHRIACRMTLDPGVSVSGVGAASERFVLRTVSDEGRPFEAELLSSHALKWQTGETAPSYGLLVPTDTLQLDVPISLPTEIAYLCRFRSDRETGD